jgi:hypothetical protein
MPSLIGATTDVYLAASAASAALATDYYTRSCRR